MVRFSKSKTFNLTVQFCCLRTGCWLSFDDTLKILISYKTRRLKESININRVMMSWKQVGKIMLQSKGDHFLNLDIPVYIPVTSSITTALKLYTHRLEILASLCILTIRGFVSSFQTEVLASQSPMKGNSSCMNYICLWLAGEHFCSWNCWLSWC